MSALHVAPSPTLDDSKTTSPQITHTVIVVTPEMARRWLGVNVANRTVRETRVAKYRDDMESGRWTFAGDPVRFDVNGVLIDGQHRLLALAEADVPDGVAFLVIRGLPPESKSVMDQGAKRTAGDQLTMRGVKNAANVASAVKQFMVWEKGYLFRDAKLAHEISTPAIEEWVHNHSVEVEHLNEVLHFIRRTESRPMVGGAMFLIFERVDPEAAAEFFRLLATGAGAEGNPINTLDQKLRRARRQGQRVTARDEMAAFIQAWNAWRAGRQVMQLLRPKGGTWTASNFPEPR